MSTLTVTNIKKTGETASRDVSGVAAAWVNFNGTGTVAIRDSLNVSSLTDSGVGSYIVNFSANFSTANYVPVCSTWQSTSADGTGENLTTPTVSSQKIDCRENNTAADPTAVNLSFHGDLA